MKHNAPPSCPTFTSPLPLLVVATLLAALALPTWHLAAGMSGNAQLSVALHTVLECLFIAGMVATFSVAWYSPRGEYRLRLVLTACLCLPVGIFDLLHLLTYPGMPDLVVLPSHQALSFYFVRITRCTLPFILLALMLTPLDSVLSTWQRLALLGATLLILLPGIAFGFSLAPDLSRILAQTAYLRTVTIVLFLFTAWLAHSRIRVDRLNATYLLYAALLGATAQACFVLSQGLGSGTPLQLFGHILDNLMMGALFVAVYGEAMRVPYAQLKQAHAMARLDMERLDTILRSTADGMLVIDTELQVLFANPVACRLLGRVEDGLSNTPLTEMLMALNATGTALITDIEICLHEGHPSTDIHYLRTAGLSALGDDIRAIEHAVSPIACPEGGIAGAVLVLRNVTAQWQLQQQLRAAASYARNLFEASPDPMMTMGPDGIIADVNCAAEIATGMGRDKLIGAYFVSRFTDPAGARIGLQRALGGETVRDLHLVLVRASGGILQASCNIAPQRDAGNIRGAIAVVRDVTDLRQAELQLQFQADCDALTALPNRRHFRECVDQALTRAHTLLGEHCTVTVMVVDLDDFRDINDTQGHTAGDELLKIMATRLTNTLHNGGTIARIGGDEFGVLLAECTQEQGIQAAADKILAAVAEPILVGDRELIVNCSIGISTHPIDSGDAAVLLKNADTAMYCAKENGKNQCQFFRPEMNAAVWRRVDIAHHLRSALARGELSLHYQPQVNLQNATVVGVEALLRWNSAELGFVSPVEFIPVAEDTGLILPIGAWVLKEACRQAASWYATSGAELCVAVNLSARQFRDENLVALVNDALAATGLPPRLLELELTEGMLMHDAARAAETMARLKFTGASLSIDDFGTGYSSLAYLKRFPLDKLKIDRSFVMDIPGDANDIAIVHSILALAHGLGLEVIAEGAETSAQIAFLRNHGCEVVQGYYVSRPLPVADVPTFLARWQEEQPLVLAKWKEAA